MKRTRHHQAVNNAIAVMQSTAAQRAAADRFRQQQIDRALRRELRKYGSASGAAAMIMKKSDSR